MRHKELLEKYRQLIQDICTYTRQLIGTQRITLDWTFHSVSQDCSDSETCHISGIFTDNNILYIQIDDPFQPGKIEETPLNDEILEVVLIVCELVEKQIFNNQMPLPSTK